MVFLKQHICVHEKHQNKKKLQILNLELSKNQEIIKIVLKCHNNNPSHKALLMLLNKLASVSVFLRLTLVEAKFT